MAGMWVRGRRGSVEAVAGLPHFSWQVLESTGQAFLAKRHNQGHDTVSVARTQLFHVASEQRGRRGRTPRTRDAERVGVAVAGVPQVTGEAELLSMYLLARCTSSLGRCQFQSVAHFLIGLFTVVFFFFLFFPSFYLEAGEWALEATFRRSQGPLSEGRGLAVTGSFPKFCTNPDLMGDFFPNALLHP